MAAPQFARASSLKLAPALAALSQEVGIYLWGSLFQPLSSPCFERCWRMQAKTLGQALEERHRMDLEAGPSMAAEAAVPASRAQPNKVRQRYFVAFKLRTCRF